jgi:hypothetical protein
VFKFSSVTKFVSFQKTKIMFVTERLVDKPGILTLIKVPLKIMSV